MIRKALICAAMVVASPSLAQSTTSSFVTLGTAAGPIANPQRSQPANLLRAGESQILVDVGDGAVDQLVVAGGEVETLDAVFISHLHFDHIGGLFALLGRRFQLVSPNVLTIYGPPGTRAVVDELLAGIDAVARSGSVGIRGGRPPTAGVEVIEIGDGSIVDLGAIKVTTVGNSHFVTRVADHASGSEPQSLSFRFDLPDRSITYTGDTGPSAAVERLARGSDVLVAEVMDVEAVMANLRQTRPDLPAQAVAMIERHQRLEHLEPAEVGQLAQRAGVGTLVLTHNAVETDGLEAARAIIQEHFSGSLHFANDLDQF